MTVHPLILAGAKGLDDVVRRYRIEKRRMLVDAASKWSVVDADTGQDVFGPADDKDACQAWLTNTATEAVIRAVAPGLLAGTHAVLPVEATEEMCDIEPPMYDRDFRKAIENLHKYRKMRAAMYRAMVAAHLKAEKQG